jgi:membrane fusion protein (multidrug efflux system)
MIKRMILMILALAVVFGGIFGAKYYIGQMIQQKMAQRQPPPVAVTTTEAAARTWQPRLHAVGSLKATKGVAISPEMAGRVTEIAFRSGQRVSAGDLLVALNTETEAAEVRRLQAQKDLAETQLRRQRRLIRQNQTSQAAVDEAAARVATLDAQIERERTLIAKKRIRAPFEGVVGIRQVDLGEFVDVGTPLVTLQDLEPLYADFTLPQKDLARVAEGMAVALTVDTYPGETFTGKITAIDPKVAEETRNVGVRATLGNADGRLRPGMFADVAVQLPAKRDVVTLPQTAVTTNPYGESVFIVQEPDGEGPATVTKRFVTTGDRRGDQVAVTEGVKPGETVVTSGQLKLREGARIKVNNEVQPASDPAPTPENR